MYYCVMGFMMFTVCKVIGKDEKASMTCKRIIIKMKIKRNKIELLNTNFSRNRIFFAHIFRIFSIVLYQDFRKDYFPVKYLQTFYRLDNSFIIICTITDESIMKILFPYIIMIGKIMLGKLAIGRKGLRNVV